MTKVSKVYFGLRRDSVVWGTCEPVDPDGVPGKGGRPACPGTKSSGVVPAYVDESTCRFVDMSPNPLAGGGWSSPVCGAGGGAGWSVLRWREGSTVTASWTS